MNRIKDWSVIEYEVGRYKPQYFDDKDTFKPYQPETKKLTWYIINYDFNSRKIEAVNLFEYNWVFLKSLLEAKKKYKDSFIDFAEEVRSALQHEFWSRCEYETIITSWPPHIDSEELDRLNEERNKKLIEGYSVYRQNVNLDVSYKIDIYTQVMMNWDRFIEYVWNNKQLITAKKLGLEK